MRFDELDQHKMTCSECGGPAFSDLLLAEKQDACYYKVKSRYKVWPSAYASGALVQCRKKGASNWGTGGKSNESVAEGSEDRRRFIRFNIWTAMDSDEEVLQHAVEGDPFYSAKKFMRDLDDQGYDFTHVISPKGEITYSPQHDPRHLKNFSDQSVAEDQLDEKWSKKYKDSINCSNPKGFSQRAHCAGKKKNEDIAVNEDKKQPMSRAAKGNEKYGKDGMKALAKAGREGASEEKLDKIRDEYDRYDEGQNELARILELGGVKLTEDLSPDEQFDIIEEMVEQLAEEHGVDAETIWEDFESVDDDELFESAAWRRKEGKNKKGGLNAKGVASYRREHPGSKLQTAVTTKPSKLKPGSKAAKRRKSFCARMSGVKGPMKKPNGKPTRKALALRKWNC